MIDALDILDVTYVWDTSGPPVSRDNRGLVKTGERILRDGELYVAEPSDHCCADCACRDCWALENKPFSCVRTILVKL